MKRRTRRRGGREDRREGVREEGIKIGKEMVEGILGDIWLRKRKCRKWKCRKKKVKGVKTERTDMKDKGNKGESKEIGRREDRRMGGWEDGRGWSDRGSVYFQNHSSDFRYSKCVFSC